MKTKYLIKFLNRLAHSEADLELVDIFKRELDAGKLTPADQHIFDTVDIDRHPRIYNRKSSDHGRVIVTSHLLKTVRASFIKDRYEDLTIYMSELIRGAAVRGFEPGRLIGEHKTLLDANDILKCKSLDDVLDLLASTLFRRLENQQSTIKLLHSINNKLGLNVSSNFLEDALPYLELRHLLVHADGIADEIFSRNYRAIRSVPGKKINLTHTLMRRAAMKISAMTREFDRKVIENETVPESDCQP